jgi:hypothetical protein
MRPAFIAGLAFVLTVLCARTTGGWRRGLRLRKVENLPSLLG